MRSVLGLILLVAPPTSQGDDGGQVSPALAGQAHHHAGATRHRVRGRQDVGRDRTARRHNSRLESRHGEAAGEARSAGEARCHPHADRFARRHSALRHRGRQERLPLGLVAAERHPLRPAGYSTGNFWT